MSYARWGEEDSSVYAYPAGEEGILTCHGCTLIGQFNEKDFTAPNHREFLNHFVDHLEHGDTVPLRCFIRIIQELRQSSGQKELLTKSKREELDLILAHSDEFELWNDSIVHKHMPATAD